MPTAPPSPCSVAQCGELVSGGGRCPSHRKARNERIDSNRGTSNERGYDSNHRILRLLCFERDAYTCQVCAWRPNIVIDHERFRLGDAPQREILIELRHRHSIGERHLHADHRIPIETDPSLRLELDNLQTLCNICHNAKTMREMNA